MTTFIGYRKQAKAASARGDHLEAAELYFKASGQLMKLAYACCIVSVLAYAVSLTLIVIHALS